MVQSCTVLFKEFVDLLLLGAGSVILNGTFIFIFAVKTPSSRSMVLQRTIKRPLPIFVAYVRVCVNIQEGPHTLYGLRFRCRVQSKPCVHFEAIMV
ncbi:hypothetical protein DL93DRAFT_2084729 [Clavulina sp. PMI_390]|nr:hypothetical protein DL93DRAFT_2084729 [Clavulina sp. PMI_390]